MAIEETGNGVMTAETLTEIEQQFEVVHRRLDALDRRIDHRFGEVRVKQEEELMLIKALSCQLRGRGERADRRGSRAG
jgi:hypothetical protein